MKKAWLKLFTFCSMLFLITTFFYLQPLPTITDDLSKFSTTALNLNLNNKEVNSPADQIPSVCFKHADPRPQLPESQICRPHHSIDKLAAQLPLTIATAASDAFWGHLRNIIGSIHLWEPGLEIAIYSLGLSPARLADASEWCGVSIIKFPFEDFPSWASTLPNFAWKAAVVKDSVERFGKVFYSDAGMELRRPIDFIKKRIDVDGYFCMGMSDTLTNGGRPTQAEYFNYTLENFLGKPQIAGTIQGLTYWSDAYKGIIIPAAECSKNYDCIVTQGPLKGETKPFGKDQTIFSELLYLHSAVQCPIDPAFTKHHSDFELPQPETVIGRSVLFHRRAQMPKPFDKYVLKWDDPKCQHKKGELKNELNWKSFKATFEKETKPAETCTCMRELRPFGDYPKYLSIVTAASSTWFEELENFVGSIHNWEPKMKVVVYDLGLSAEQLTEIRRWRNVEVVPFVPSCQFIEISFAGGSPLSCENHFKQGTWRPFVLLHAAITRGEFLFLSAGHELRNILEPLALQLYRDSIFTVTVTHDLTRFADDKLFSALGASHDFYEFKPVCSPGVFGYICSEDIKKNVLIPMVKCARDYQNCWSIAPRDKPEPDSTQRFSNDDLVMTAILLNNSCYTCNRDLPYYAYRGNSEPTRQTIARIPEHMFSTIDVIFNRRKEHPKPYKERIIKNQPLTPAK